jgi:hypothetical protein
VGANVPVAVALYRNAMLFLGLFGIGFLFIANSKFQLGPIPNVVAPSCWVILGAMTLVGSRALMITSFDYYFLGFMLLSVTSHIFANEFLFRQLGMTELEGNFKYILTVLLVYRAHFCMVYLAPKIGSRLLIASEITVLTFVSLLGIVQRFGPSKATAIHLGGAITIYGQQISDAATVFNRPSGVFTNPNILGYSACVLTAFVLGWGLERVNMIRPWKTAAVVVLLSIAILCSVACQSRQSFAVLVFTPIVFAIGVRLNAKDGKNMAVLSVLVAVAAFGLVTAATSTKSDYFTHVFSKGVKKDESYLARTEEYKKLQQISTEIAAGGTGQSMSNVNEVLLASEHSRYNTEVIDSEWGNMFQAFGVWGPLLLAIFFLLTARDTRQIWQIDDPDARMIAIASAMLLGVNLMLTAAAVRVSKFETSMFTFELLGALSAWRIYGLERGLINNRVVKRQLKSAA